MSAQSELSHFVGLWVEKAENDLRNATYMLTLEEDCPYDTICFHAQQCVEKYLKALLVWLQIEFPKTHDLPELLSRIPTELGLHSQLPQISLLNRYAVEARYPGYWEPITREEAKESIAIAQTIRSIVRGHLIAEGFRGM